MYKSFVPIFIILIFFCSCSGKSEQAADLINKANALLSEKEFNEPQKAIDYLTEAVKLQPDNHEIYNMRGCIYMTTGKNQLAYDDFNKAIQLNPKNADYYNNRGTLYEKTGHHKHAIKDFDEAILYDSNAVQFYNNRGSVHLHYGDQKIGCLDAERACELKSCDLLEWAKKQKYCK